MKDTIESITLSDPKNLVYLLLNRERLDPTVILDLGCGYGEDALLLRLLFPQSLIISCDILRDMCDYVKHKEVINEVVICCDATRLPLKDGSIDLVVCEQVIEHVEEQDKLIDEMARVLRPEGRMVVGSIIQRKGIAIGFFRNKQGKRVLSSQHVREYGNEEEFVSLFQGHFHIHEVITAPYTMQPLGMFYMLLAMLKLIKFNPKFWRQRIRFWRKIILPRPGYSYIYALGSRRCLTG